MRSLLGGALLLLASVSYGDEVVLGSGARLSCEVLEETPEQITIRLPHGTMSIPRSRIVRIVRESRAAYLKREASSSLRAGSTGNALDLYRRACRADPDDAEARRGYRNALLEHARALARTQHVEAARAVLATLLEEEPENRVAKELVSELARASEENEKLHGRAVAAFAGGDFAAALALFDAWRLRRPLGDPLAKTRMATVHAAAGQVDLERGALRPALDHFRAARSFGEGKRVVDELFLLEPVAILESLAEGDAASASRSIERIASRYPDRAVPVFLRAVAHHVRGDVKEAVAAYAEAARAAETQGQAPTGGLAYATVRSHATAMLRAVIARPPQEGQARWRELFLAPLHRHDGAEHFTVYAPTASQAAELGRAADEIYVRIARELLGAAPSAAKAELIAHASRQAYLAADPLPPQSPMSVLAMPRFRSKGVMYKALDQHGGPVLRIELFLDPRTLPDTLPHEVVHVVQRRGLPVHRRGHWLDEGLATLYESGRAQGQRRQSLGGESLLPLAELISLRSTPPERAGLFYAQSYALSAHLRGLGTAAEWRRFLAAYAKVDFERAVRDVYDIESVDALERLFRAELKRAQ